MQPKTNIFVIYALEDKQSMLDILHYLKPLEKDYNLAIWDDDPILSRQLWQPQNESYIHLTDIFLLLISDHFMHSEFINQLEFKLVIDRYKDEKAVVLPIIIDKCQWDIEFKSDDYDFKLSELHVLPEEGKPITAWDSPDLAYKQVRKHLKQVLSSFGGNQKESDTVQEIEETNTQGEEQLAISFSEATEAQRKADEEKRRKEATEARRRAEEEQRIREAAEAKSRAEEAARLKEEAAAKRIAEEENRLREKAEAKRKAEENELIKPTAEIQNGDLEEASQQNPKLKKRILLGAAVGIIAIVLIWAFSLFNGGDEIQSPPVPTKDTITAKDSTASTTTKNNMQKQPASPSKLSIGDSFEEGIVFTIDLAAKKGKIAYTKDAGPMTWKNAIKIHEQLGEGWRLPTFDELAIMYRNIGQGDSNIGEFSNGLYWSATDFDEYQARLIRFSDGNTSYHYNKELEHRKYLVRAIRDISR